MAGESQSTVGYIQHHLTNLTYGKLPAGYERLDAEGHVHEVLPEATWTLAHSSQEAADMGFMAIHVDSMLWSIGLGFLFLLIFARIAKRAQSGVPRGAQNAIEMIIGFIDQTVKDGFHHKNAMIAPMALTIFMWIFLMNTMDLVPVDWIPQLAALILSLIHI